MPLMPLASVGGVSWLAIVDAEWEDQNLKTSECQSATDRVSKIGVIMLKDFRQMCCALEPERYDVITAEANRCSSLCLGAIVHR